MKKVMFKGYDLNTCSSSVLSKLCYTSFYDHFLDAAFYAIKVPTPKSFLYSLVCRNISYSYYLRLRNAKEVFYGD